MSMLPFRPTGAPAPRLARSEPGMPPLRWTHAVLLLAWAASGSAGMHLFRAEPWHRAIAYGAALVVYVSAFVLLARQHRRGVTPYSRRAGYGVALAGAFAGVVWAVVARESVGPGVIGGLVASGLHYTVVRLLRGAARPHPDAPGLSPE